MDFPMFPGFPPEKELDLNKHHIGFMNPPQTGEIQPRHGKPSTQWESLWGHTANMPLGEPTSFRMESTPGPKGPVIMATVTIFPLTIMLYLDAHRPGCSPMSLQMPRGIHLFAFLKARGQDISNMIALTSVDKGWTKERDNHLKSQNGSIYKERP